jgi:cytochrome b subunit of formate dehydrogenase
MTAIFRTVVAIVLMPALLPGLPSGLEASAGERPSSGDCLSCHERTIGEINPDYDQAVAVSAHAGMECLDCHSAIQELPHDEELPQVNCGQCHLEEEATYQWHGRLRVPDGEDIPSCADCHGRHDILPSTDKHSRVHPTNLPETCGRCHENLDLIKKHEIYVQKPIEIYKSSVHGKASLGGIYLAATCNDCHSAGGTAHRILSPGAAESPINHFNIPHTCGRCHKSIENDYWEGIHGKLTARGETDSPVCTQCHGEHGILSPSDPRSPVHPVRIAEATCAPCHESAYLNEKYGVPIGRLKSFIDSYHGLKSKAGDVTVANCASCHGAHRILPASDPTSSIHPANLQETCGHCHPGISKDLALTGIHAPPGIAHTPAAVIFQNIYIVAIVVIIGAMVIHWLIDLRRKILNVMRLPQTRRMNYNEVWQHTFLMVTFIVLAITGFSLRYSDAGWVKLLFGWEGGFPLRGIIHRVAAVLFIITSLWHLVYMVTPRGRRFFKDIFPAKKDFVHFFQMIKYNLDRSNQKPKFGRFSYIEKAEYWALVWGTVVMIITGFFLWFDNIAVQWFPKGFLDVMLVVHHYEAWLAVLAVAIWHMYSTVFSPNVYPMNPSWLTGKMPAAWHAYEHSEDASLEEDESKEVTKNS